MSRCASGGTTRPSTSSSPPTTSTTPPTAAARRVDFVGQPIRVLAPADLATFKVLFDRTKDWADIEAMLDSGTLDVDEVVAELVVLLGDDPRVERLRAMVPR